MHLEANFLELEVTKGGNLYKKNIFIGKKIVNNGTSLLVFWHFLSSFQNPKFFMMHGQFSGMNSHLHS